LSVQISQFNSVQPQHQKSTVDIQHLKAVHSHQRGSNVQNTQSQDASIQHLGLCLMSSAVYTGPSKYPWRKKMGHQLKTAGRQIAQAAFMVNFRERPRAAACMADFLRPLNLN
jgi:hypothetical protein